MNRLLSILLALALVVSLSVTVFADNEQPSGSQYKYFNNSTVNYSANYWTAVTNSLFNIGTNIYKLNNGSFNYTSTSGSSSSTSSGALDAITKSLTNIGYLIKNQSISVNSVWTSTQASNINSKINDIATSTGGLNSGTYQIVDSTGSASTSSSGYMRAVTQSLTAIGLLIKNSCSSSSVWTSAQATAINNNVSSIKTDIGSIKTYTSDIPSIEDRATEISDYTFDISSYSSNISAKSTMIEGHTSVIANNTPSIKTNTDSINSYTSSLVTNSNTLLSVLGTPDSGSTFWSNALASKVDLDYLRSMTAGQESQLTFILSNGNRSTDTTNYWSGLYYSLRNGLLNIIEPTKHIDSDFHSLHNKLGTPIDEGSTFFSLLTDLHTVFASPEDLEMHNNNSDNYAQANDDFFTGQDSSSSIGTGTLSSLKGVADNVGSFFQVDSSISPTAIFGLLDQANDGSDGPWKWFSRTTLNDLDKVQSTRKSVPEGQEIVDFLTPHEEEFQDMLGADKR